MTDRKVIRYICELSLAVTPITGDTPLPDPCNPYKIREMTDEEYKEYENN